MKISIIIPVYNVEKYLKRCIESVLNQTYHDFELILINDGSKDNSGYICDEYARCDERIKVVHQENKGVSVARNKGIELATGEYIMFIDSDDFIELNTLQILVQILDKEKYDLVVYGYIMEFIYNNYKKINISPNNKVYDDVKLYLKEFSYYRSNGIFGYVFNKLYNTKIIKENKILFSENISFAEDVYFNFDILPFCNNIKVINNNLYHYMHQSYNTLSKIQHNEPYTSNEIYYKTVKFLKKMNSYDVNANFVNSTYIEALINYISLELFKDKNRINKLRLLYKEEQVRYAIYNSYHNLIFYKIMNKMIKFNLPITTIIFLYIYKYYSQVKCKLKRG